MPAKKPKLTMKQAKFVKGIAEGKTNHQAAIDAYDIESKDVVNVASSIAAENLQKPTIQEAIELARVKLGITPELALMPVAEALHSDELDMRLKGSDRALKLMGVGKAETPTNIVQIINEQKNQYGI